MYLTPPSSSSLTCILYQSHFDVIELLQAYSKADKLHWNYLSCTCWSTIGTHQMHSPHAHTIACTSYVAGLAVKFHVTSCLHWSHCIITSLVKCIVTALSLSQPLYSAVEGGEVRQDGGQSLSRIGSNEVGCYVCACSRAQPCACVCVVCVCVVCVCVGPWYYYNPLYPLLVHITTSYCSLVVTLAQDMPEVECECEQKWRHWRRSRWL